MVEFLQHHGGVSHGTMVKFLQHHGGIFTTPWWSFTELLALTKNQPPEPPKANGGEKAT